MSAALQDCLTESLPGRRQRYISQHDLHSPTRRCVLRRIVDRSRFPPHDRRAKSCLRRRWSTCPQRARHAEGADRRWEGHALAAGDLGTSMGSRTGVDKGRLRTRLHVQCGRAQSALPCCRRIRRRHRYRLTAPSSSRRAARARRQSGCARPPASNAVSRVATTVLNVGRRGLPTESESLTVPRARTAHGCACGGLTEIRIA